jgi:hypothetical protein
MYPISAVFSILINHLCSCIRLSKFHFYADDLQIYLSRDRKDLAAMSRWSAVNGLLPPQFGGDSDSKFCCGHGAV